jgi:predicted phage-related endonuclease
MTRLDAYFAIVEGRQPKQSEPMYWGSKLEPLIRERYEAETGYKVEYNKDPDKLGIEVVHQNHEFITGSLDGVVSNSGIFEAKTARDRSAWEDGVPEIYQVQVQHYMGITGRLVTDVAVLFGASDFEIFEVKRDNEIIDNLFALEVAFWKKHVIPCVPPEPETYSDVNLRWRTSTAKAVEADEWITQLYKELTHERHIMGDTARRIEGLEMSIKKYMEDSDTLIVDGKKAVTWKQAKPSMSFDKGRLKADDPEMFNRYMVERPGSRRFLVK